METWRLTQGRSGRRAKRKRKRNWKRNQRRIPEEKPDTGELECARRRSGKTKPSASERKNCYRVGFCIVFRAHTLNCILTTAQKVILKKASWQREISGTEYWASGPERRREGKETGKNFNENPIGLRIKRRKNQATKSTGWMPGHHTPMKDAVSCEKLRGTANKLRSAGIRMGKPSQGNAWLSCTEYIGA